MFCYDSNSFMRGKETYRLVLVLFGSLVVSFLLYGNTVHGEFVYDDKFFSERQELRSADHLDDLWTESFLPKNETAGQYKPVPATTFSLNYIFFGESTASFHITNIVLNAVAIFLVYLVVWQLFRNQLLAVLAAFLFALFPIHTEAVANIKSRDEILMAIFALGSWSAFLRATKSKQKIDWRFMGLCAVFALFALLSKEFAIAIPLLLLLTYWARRSPSWRRLLTVSLPFIGIAVVYALLRLKALGEYAFHFGTEQFVINPLAHVDLFTRLWTAGKIAFYYIGKTFIPWDLSATYHYNHLTLVKNPLISWQALAGFVLLGAFIYLLASKRWRPTPLGVGAAAFLPSYLIFSKIIFKSGDIFAERWMYFPSVGLAIICAFALVRLYEYHKQAAIALLAVLAVAYAWVILPRNKVWLSEKDLYESMVQTAPNSVSGHTALAGVYFDEQEFQSAAEQVRLAAAIYPDDPYVLNQLGILSAYRGDYQSASKYFAKSFKINPLQGVNLIFYARSLTKLGRYEESIAVLQKYLSEEQNAQQVRFTLAVNYWRLGNQQEAKKYFDGVPADTLEEKIRLVEGF
jgi:Tfp pilus assembly protein PilF